MYIKQQWRIECLNPPSIPPSLPPLVLPLSLSLSPSLPLLPRTQFTLKELQKRPLPEGVDPSKLETYISDNEFEVNTSYSLTLYSGNRQCYNSDFRSREVLCLMILG